MAKPRVRRGLHSPSRAGFTFESSRCLQSNIECSDPDFFQRSLVFVGMLNALTPMAPMAFFRLARNAPTEEP